MADKPEVDVKKLVESRGPEGIFVGEPIGIAYPLGEEGGPFWILSPCWQDIGGFVPGPGGQGVGRNRLLVPLDWFTSLNEAWVRPTGIVPLKGLSDGDAGELKQAIRQAEDVRAQVRGKQAGIELTNKMPTLPKGN